MVAGISGVVLVLLPKMDGAMPMLGLLSVSIGLVAVTSGTLLQKKIGGKSHVCSNPKERKDKQEKAPTEKEINKDLQDVVLQNFPFPGVYTVDQFANIDGANNDKPLEDIATCPDDKCVICNKTGTHAAGNETSFLECHVCNKVVIHYSCLEEFTMEWTCASCNGD